MQRTITALVYTEISTERKRRLGGRVSLFRVVEEMFPLVKTFGEEFRSLVKAGFLRMVENKKYLIFMEMDF